MARSKKNQPTRRRAKTTDGLRILHDRYIRRDREMSRLVAEERSNMDVAQRIYDLREKAGLSQRALARLVGTTASVICRLEDADYDGHSLAMLNRIAAALNRRVEIRFVPIRKAV
jgi:ribosome-binding protein aMBF1 (putative translation factor)